MGRPSEIKNRIGNNFYKEIEYLKSGKKKIREVAIKYGITSDGLRLFLKREGIKFPPANKKALALLPKNKADSLANKVKKDKISYQQIADEFGMSYGTIAAYFLKNYGIKKYTVDYSKKHLQKLFGNEKSMQKLVLSIHKREKTSKQICYEKKATYWQFITYARMLNLDLNQKYVLDNIGLNKRELLSIKKRIQNNKISIKALASELEVTWDALKSWLKKEGIDAPDIKKIALNRYKEYEKLYGNSRQYYAIARAMTERTYWTYQHLINPRQLKLGRGYFHIDHILSIHDGFTRKVKVKLKDLCHPANLQLLSESDNIRKGKRSDISYSELKRRIIDWELKYEKK